MLASLRRAGRVAVLAILALCASGALVHAATTSVPAGGNLQAALNNAQPGDVILLQPGATYVGNFVLPFKGGASFITLQTAPAGQPPFGARIHPTHAPLLAKLRSPNGSPALRTAPGAHHWWIALIEFLANVGGTNDIIQLGDGSAAQQSLAQVPYAVVIDRCYIHAEPGTPQKRGIALNSAATTVTGSYISEIKAVGQDSQAISGWNGPGPFAITNNYLEAAAENVMFGGADPAIPNLVPSDIEILNNTFSKPTRWRSEKWVVKNLFELKNARRVTIRGNVFEYNWQSAQSGFAILFTVRNQDGGCLWCQVEDVLFEENVVRHVSAGVNILGFDDIQTSQQTRRITIRNNLFVDIDTARWGGNKGYFLQLLNDPLTITVDHNTVIQGTASGILWAEGPAIEGFKLTNNLLRHNTYGIIGNATAPGLNTITTYFPASVIAGNVIADANPALYPTGNLFPSSSEFGSEFVSSIAGDYRLLPGSPWRGAGTDGLDRGALLGPLTSRMHVNLDTPGQSQHVGQPFAIAGWALDEGNPGGIGVDAVHVYAYPNPGSGQPAVYLGAAAVGIVRPDIAQAFGARFSTAGFSLSARGLPPGVYQVAAFAHSTLSDQFTAATATVSVQATTIVVVDRPAGGAIVRPPFVVAGWTADTAALTGVGIDAIHVWAFPADGKAPIFAGEGVPGGTRPDVAAALGSSQFAPSGYDITIASLPPGDYQLAVYAHSTVSGTFTSQIVPIRVIDSAEVVIDSPPQNGVVVPSFDVSGWAVDTSAPTGTGISAVHVWAYPASGAAAIFLGEASYGGLRPDVGAIFGTRFGQSAFRLTVPTLAPGAYDIVVYGFSTVSGSFSANSTRRISVN